MVLEPAIDVRRDLRPGRPGERRDRLRVPEDPGLLERPASRSGSRTRRARFRWSTRTPAPGCRSATYDICVELRAQLGGPTGRCGRPGADDREHQPGGHGAARRPSARATRRRAQLPVMDPPAQRGRLHDHGGHHGDGRGHRDPHGHARPAREHRQAQYRRDRQDRRDAARPARDGLAHAAAALAGLLRLQHLGDPGGQRRVLGHVLLGLQLERPARRSSARSATTRPPAGSSRSASTRRSRCRTRSRRPTTPTSRTRRTSCSRTPCSSTTR